MNRKRFLPNPTQELLLGVCLHRDPASAARCWKQWKAQVDLDDLDSASFHIMSLVYLRLRDAGIDDPDLGRIKGLHRYRWTQSQVGFRGKQALLKALSSEKVPTMLLRGAALAGTVYPEPTARGIHDTDILAPARSAPNAVQLLAAHGWLARDFDPVRTIESLPGCPLLHPDYGEVYLHWRIIRARCREEGDEWQASAPFQFEDTPTRIPSAADQLLHACEHGVNPWSRAGLQWLADCVFLIRNSNPPLDWARLVEQSRRYQLSLHTRGALIYLRNHFENSIPREVIAELARSPVSLDGRIEYFLAGRPEGKQHDLVHKFAAAACRYIGMKSGGRLRQLLRDIRRLPRVLSRSIAG